MSLKALSSKDAARLEQSFIVGLSRSPPPSMEGLDGSANRALAALAVLGQRKRFQPAAATPRTPDPILPADDRPVLRDEARTIYRHLLLGDKSSTWHVVAEAVRDRIDERGLRIHPFDLPWIDKFLPEMERYRRLGPTEAAWRARSKGQAEETTGDQEIDDENWGQFTKAGRLAYLRERRAADASAGRSLLETVFANEPATLRAHLVVGLEVGLGPEDCAFLEQARSDRAKSVRDAAETMLGRIPGTAAYAERCGAVLAAIELRSAGLISRRQHLTIRKPKGESAHPRNPVDWIMDLEGISIADLAKHFGLAVDEVLPAAAGDEVLLSALLRNAAREGRLETIVETANGGHTGWTSIIPFVQDIITLLPAERRRAFVSGILGRDRFTSFLLPGDFIALYRTLAGPLDDRDAEALLSAVAFRDFLSTISDQDPASDHAQTLNAIAPLIPSSLAERFLADIDPLPREIKLRPTLYHRFVAALDA